MRVFVVLLGDNWSNLLLGFLAKLFDLCPVLIDGSETLVLDIFCQLVRLEKLE